MPSKTAEDAARNLIADIEGDINVMTDYEVVPLLARHFQAFAEEYHKQNTPVVSQDAEGVAREIIKKYNSHAYHIKNSDDIKYVQWEYDKELGKEIQSFADSQTAELREENEKLKTELRDYMSDSLLNAALEAEHGE